MNKKNKDDNKPTPAEWGGMIGFVTTLFITLEATFSIFVGFGCFLIVFLVNKYLINKKSHENKSMKNKGLFLLLLLFLFFVTDTLLTYYAVLYLKIANEVNPVVVFIWENLGVLKGEILRYTLIISIFYGISYQLKSKIFNRSAVAFILILFLLVVWSLVITNNIYQLLR